MNDQNPERSRPWRWQDPQIGANAAPTRCKTAGTEITLYSKRVVYGVVSVPAEFSKS